MSDRLRRPIAGLIIVTVGCLSGFGFAVRSSHRPLLFDSSVDKFLRLTSGLPNRLAHVLSQAGDPKIFVTITALVALGLVVVGDHRAALAAVLSVALAVLVVEEVLKPFFDRRLGNLPGPVFPSGHTAVSLALAGTIVLATGPDRPLAQLVPRTFRHLLAASVLGASCAIGTAMIVLQLHYLTDVLAAAPLGLSISALMALFLDSLAARWAQSTILDSGGR